MESNIILLFETQCPVFDSDCSPSLPFSLCWTFACRSLCANNWWEGFTKGSVRFYKDSSQVHGSNSFFFSSSPNPPPKTF